MFTKKDAYLKTAQGFELKWRQRDKRDKTIAFIIAAVGTAFGLLSLIAIIILLPLKQTNTELYVADKLAGTVERVTTVEKGELSENSALARYFTQQYVRLREGYDYFRLQHDYDTVQRYGNEVVNKAYLDWWNSPSAPDKVFKDAEYTAEITFITNFISASSNPDNPDLLSTLRFLDILPTLKGEDVNKGWNVTKEGNRVYIRVAPVKQPIRTIKSGEDGDEEVESERVFEPQDKDWRTNLFVTTTKHFYSLELRLIDKGQPLSQLAYVIDYRYPQEEQAQTRKTQQARQREWEKAQMKQSIAQAFNAAQAPRNWDYYMRVAKDSRDIAPDFAYDDGRFTYLGFSPIKTFPAAFVAYGEKEHIVNASVQQKGNYKVLVIHQINPRFVLRAGHKVVGIENHGVGKVTVPDGNTISPHVERVETEQ